MSEFNKQQQNPYPRGSGTGSVPVLFSLINVQPALVSGSANKTPSNQSSPKTEASQAAIVPPIVPLKDAKPARTGNRLYNGAILVLVMLLLALAIRNSQGRNNTSSVAKESDKTIVPVKSVVDARADKIPAISFQPIEPLVIGLDPIRHPSTRDPQFDSNASSPLELTSSKNDSLPSDSVAASKDANDSSAPFETPTAPTFPSTPFLLAASGSTNISAKPDTSSIPKLDDSAASPTRPSAVPTPQSHRNPSAHSPAPLGSPSEITSASSVSPPPEAIVDTGVKLTTRQLIDAYRSKQDSAYPAFSSVPANTVASNTVVNNTVARAPSNGGTPYAPIGNEVPLTSTPPTSEQPIPSRTTEYQPLYPYEQNAINVNSTGFPVTSTDPQSQAIRQPTLNGSNRYQGQPTQKAPYAPYQTMAPAQGANSVGYPPSN